MKTFLSEIHKIDDRILDKYMALWHEYTLPGRNLMTSEGDIERHMYFVLEGVQKSYYLHGDKQHIVAFTYPPGFSGIPESFFSQTPSRCFLQTITDSRFLRISFDAHQAAMEQYREIDTLFRKATETILIGLVQRQYELMAFDIKARFKKFAERSPHLFNMVSQKDLASYLRIDPTNLSKLLNNVRI